MSIREQIDSILEVRKRKAADLEKKRVKIEKLQQYLSELDNFKDRVMDIEDDEIRQQYSEIFGAIDIYDIEELTYGLTDKIDVGINRFSRDYISIATVGRARQGKSTFLQAVGNINNDIIPAYDAGDCTGATSIIQNAPDMAEGTVSVQITFKKPQDLVAIVEGYINQINPDYLKTHTVEFNKIRLIPLKELEASIASGEASKATALKHLTKICKNFNSFKSYFGRTPITLTDPEEIKTYVAQNNGKSDNDPGVKYYYNYLAVERADISCRFYEDCGKIVLVDTVGLGDTQLGIEESMLRTVDEQCDAAIVITKPIAGVHKEDLDIYNMLREKFSEREMKYWLFYVGNLHKGNNDNAVDTFVNNIKNGGNFDVCDCRKIDCSNIEEVNKQFMQPLLTKLVENMEIIDGAYLKELEGLNRKIINQCKKLIESIPQLKERTAQQGAGIKAYQAGMDAYKKLSAQLRKRVIRLREEKELPNTAMWNKSQRILNDLDNIIPTAETLQEIIDNNGALMPNSLWEQACNYTRNEISDRFASIEDVMVVETADFKNSLVKPMYDALEQIFIDNADEDDTDDETDAMDWLKGIMDMVIKDHPEYHQIFKAFIFLYDFQFRTRETIVQEIRKQLYSINPVSAEYVQPDYNFNMNDTGEQVYYYLTTRLAVIEDELRHSLFKLYRMPNQTFYTAAEEFYDRITFAIDLSGNAENHFIDMSTVWGNFFMQYNESIWKVNAQKFDKINKIIKDFNYVREHIMEDLERI